MLRKRTAFTKNNNEVLSNRGLDQTAILKKIVFASRQSGRLNLSSQGLKELPSLVFEDEEAGVREISFENDSNSGWWERVDLVRLLAADNQLLSINPRVGELGALAVLDLHGNNISELPLSLQNLQNLKMLNLSYNRISSYPPELCDLPLTELQLQNNELTDLPSNFGYLVNLIKLDLSANKLEYLPDSLSSLTSCQELNLASNSLKSMDPVDLNRLEMLRVLILSHNQFGNLTYRKSITLTRLEVLDLKYNQLKSWTTVLLCPRLKDFCLAFNKISSVGLGTFCKSKELEVFDIRDNNVGSVPADVLQLFQLKRLDLTNNSIALLPPELHLLKQLVAIHWSGNPLRGLPTTGIPFCLISTSYIYPEGGTVKLLEYLSKKYVPKDDDPQEVAPPLPKANNKNLELSGLNLKTITVDDVKATSKTLPSSLNLAQNQLSKLPDDFEQICINLSSLSINKNKLTEFPSLSSCKNLVTLDLSGNLLSTVFNIAPIPTLNSLNLNNNRLSTFPPLPFPNLSVLLISSNKLQNIDMLVLNQMKCLNVLDLSNNDIQRVPPELGNLKSINNLQITGNSFKIPRNQILTKGTTAIMEYLRSRIAI